MMSSGRLPPEDFLRKTEEEDLRRGKTSGGWKTSGRRRWETEIGRLLRKTEEEDGEPPETEDLRSFLIG